MTAKELIKAPQDLGEENIDRGVVMFDGLSYYTPYKIKILDKDWGERLQGKIMIN